MPYLHLDVNNKYAVATKQLLAGRLSQIYSSVMVSDPRRMTVTIRELGEGSVWRCGQGEPYPGALLMCEIRGGRSRDVREQLAGQLVAACNEILGLRPNELNIEFTQHTGDEMYHQWMGTFSEDWDKDEQV